MIADLCPFSNTYVNSVKEIWAIVHYYAAGLSRGHMHVQRGAGEIDPVGGIVLIN